MPPRSRKRTEPNSTLGKNGLLRCSYTTRSRLARDNTEREPCAIQKAAVNIKLTTKTQQNNENKTQIYSDVRSLRKTKKINSKKLWLPDRKDPTNNVHNINRTHPHRKPDATSGGVKLILKNSIPIYEHGDKNGGWPTDVVGLVINGVEVVAFSDNYNGTVKSVFEKDGTLYGSVLHMDYGPWSMTKLPSGHLAVTNPRAKQILTIEVAPRLVLQTTTKTRKQYWGIASLSATTLAVGARYPPSIDIIDNMGRELRSFNPVIGVESLIKLPNFLCRSASGDILVSDYGSKSVVCVTAQGGIVFRYKSERGTLHPHGIGTTTSGDILVSSFSTDSVVQLTKSGDLVRNIVPARKTLKQPYGLFPYKQNEVLICDWGKYSIKVFQLA